MAYRIEVTPTIPDPRARAAAAHFLALGISGNITEIVVVDAYTIDKKLTSDQVKKIAGALANPLTQTSSVHPKGEIASNGAKKYDIVIEIGFLPGVTDNVGHTAREIAEDLLGVTFGAEEGIYTSRKYFIAGKLSPKDAQTIAKSLYNPLIQRCTVQTRVQYEKTKQRIIVPQVNLDQATSQVIEVDLNVSDAKLAEIGEKGIATNTGITRGPLALPLVYMKAIQKHFKTLGRNPTDIELETLAQTWSEHCKHTIFRDPIDDIQEGLFERYIKGATEEILKSKVQNPNVKSSSKSKNICLSVFTDNSGIIEFDRDWAITHKVETHNSPSALDPFGGAITGIVGVNRDALGTGIGARPIANFYAFFTGRPDDTRALYRDKERTSAMLPPRRILDGVVAGVNAGGNQSGIPTPQGFVYFDDRYRGKPLVFGGTVGLLPRRINGKPSHIKKANPGDYIVMVGGRVGLDGIHGATLASIDLSAGSPATAVQIGDPITQKKMSDAIIRDVRDRGLYTSITDCGAGGLSSAVGEMARQSGGCEVELEKVPLKYPGLSPWQIWISESQERMLLACAPKNLKKLREIFTRRGVEATAIGTFTKNPHCIVKYKGQVILDLDMKFLHEGLPPRPMKTRKPDVNLERIGRLVDPAPESKRDPEQARMTNILRKMLQDYNFASYEWISDQYDSIVLGSAVSGPVVGRGRVNADVAVIRPVLSNDRGVVLSHGVYPKYTEADPYAMAACSIDTAIRTAVAAGADLAQLALLDNFCWCSPDDPERLWQLKEAARGAHDYAVAYDTPYISGKDSMYNDFRGFDDRGRAIKISVYPTLLITSIGIIEDVHKAVTLDFKAAGDLIYVVGETGQVEVGTVPQVDATQNKKVYQKLQSAIAASLIASSQSLKSGGLLYALAKSAMGGRLGADISVDDYSTLLSEPMGQVLVSVPAGKTRAFEKRMGPSARHIGTVRPDQKFKILSKKVPLIETEVDTMLGWYRSVFSND